MNMSMVGKNSNESCSICAGNVSNIYSELEKEDDMYVELHSLEAKVLFTIVACISVLSTLTAIILMHRSKKIPYGTKFLSRGLLSFDLLFIVSSTVRKFITHPVINLHVHVFVILSLQLTNITICLMALERYCLIVKPFRYTASFTKRNFRKIVISVWLCNIVCNLFVQYGACYINFRTELVFTKAGFCLKIVSPFHGLLLFVVVVTSCTCYVKIFRCLRSKLSSGNTLSTVPMSRKFQNYSSTFVVFLNVLVIVLASLAYVTILLLYVIKGLRPTTFRLALETVSISNCILNPFMYVLWFRECRLQLIMFLSLFLKRYRDRAEQMRIEVFNIVTKDVANQHVVTTEATHEL